MKKTHALLITAGAIALLLVPKLSSAFLGFSDTKMILSYPCLGLDGVPITDATLSSQCCDGSGNLVANAPAACATSMYGAGISEATSGTIGAIQTAQTAIDAANDLNGVTTNYAGTSPTPTSGTSAVSSAITSSGVGSVEGDGSDSGIPSASTARNAGNDSGANAGGGANASGNSSALGTTGGTDANLTAPAIPSGEGSDGGAYAKSGNGNGQNGSGSGGKIGGLYGSLFGNNSRVPGDGMDGFLGAKSGGSGSSSGADGGIGGASSLDGTTIDPADYFSRIDKSASLFEVVSNRYAKVNARKPFMK
jgi:hypothetical protein